MYLANKYFYFIMFHFSSTVQFDGMLENELLTFALFPIGMNDSMLDQIRLRAPCRNELWSKTDLPLYFYFERNLFSQSKSRHSLNATYPILVVDITAASHPPPEFILFPSY